MNLSEMKSEIMQSLRDTVKECEQTRNRISELKEGLLNFDDNALGEAYKNRLRFDLCKSIVEMSEDAYKVYCVMCEIRVLELEC